MFTSIIDTSSGSISFASASICMVVALVLGIMVAVVYMLQGKYTKNFVITLALLPVLVQIVILMVNGNLGTSVAVLGTFGLIRFRSVPGTSKEITSIFFAMAIGLACGMGQILFAAIFAVLVAIVLLLLSKSSFGERKEIDKDLRILIPEDLDYTGIFDDIFEEYTRKVRLNKVKTVNMGSMYELAYQVELRDPSVEKDMMDAIRCRNGNLSISCGRIADAGPEL